MFKKIFELTDKDLLRKSHEPIKTLKIQPRDRAKRLSGTKLKRFHEQEGTLIFQTPSEFYSKNGKKYAQHIKLLDYEKYRNDSSLNYNQRADAMLKGDLSVNCNCPANLYYGGAYLLTKAGAKWGRKERRPPSIKNPRQRGVGCKHLIRALQVMPFYRNEVASAMKQADITGRSRT